MNGADVQDEVVAQAQANAQQQAEEASKRGAPLFEVMIPASIAVLNGRYLHHFKIWPDGHVEGFESLGNRPIVHTRMPEFLYSVAAPICEVANQLTSVIEHLESRAVGKVDESGATVQIPGSDG